MSPMGNVGVVGGGNLGEQIKSLAMIRPIASTGAVHTGIVVDRRRFNVMLVTVQGGAATGAPTGQTANFKIQESATSGGSYADAVAGQIGGVAITEQTADDFSVTLLVDMRGMLDFVKGILTTVLTAGTTPTWPVSADTVLAGASELPTA